jgi:hypothetical protein
MKTFKEKTKVRISNNFLRRQFKNIGGKNDDLFQLKGSLIAVVGFLKSFFMGVLRFFCSFLWVSCDFFIHFVRFILIFLEFILDSTS